MQSLQEVTVGLLAELHYTELHDPYSGNGPGERREGGGPPVPRSSSKGVRGSRGLTEHGFSQGQCTVQFSSVPQLCPSPCHPMDCSTPGFPVHHQLPDLVQTHVHWVCDAIQPSHPLLSHSGGDGTVYIEHLWEPMLFRAPFKVSPCLKGQRIHKEIR